MKYSTKYVIFETKWGYFGILGTKFGLFRTCLPLPGHEKVKNVLLKDFTNARFDKAFFKSVQTKVVAYFEGEPVDFGGDISVDLDGLSDFSKKVLAECRKVNFSERISYKELAERTGRPEAVRAVGGALARNPLALIIPCHRVICSNGKIGGFSAAGGVKLKKKLLRFECETI